MRTLCLTTSGVFSSYMKIAEMCGDTIRAAAAWIRPLTYFLTGVLRRALVGGMHPRLRGCELHWVSQGVCDVDVETSQDNFSKQVSSCARPGEG